MNPLDRTWLHVVRFHDIEPAEPVQGVGFLRWCVTCQRWTYPMRRA